MKEFEELNYNGLSQINYRDLRKMISDIHAKHLESSLSKPYAQMDLQLMEIEFIQTIGDWNNIVVNFEDIGSKSKYVFNFIGFENSREIRNLDLLKAVFELSTEFYLESNLELRVKKLNITSALYRKISSK